MIKSVRIGRGCGSREVTVDTSRSKQIRLVRADVGSLVLLYYGCSGKYVSGAVLGKGYSHRTGYEVV